MMKNKLAGLLLASSLGLGLTACNDRAPQVIAVPQQTAVAQPGVMTVTGQATLEVSPDCADLTMTLVIDGAKPSIATRNLANKEDELVAALQKLGIEKNDIKLSMVTLNPIYKDWPQTKIITYRAEVTITATTHKFEQVADMMEAGANAGATSMSSNFRRSDLPELKKKVREMALKAAKEKAELTAKTLGIEIGRVTSVAEVPAGYMWSNAYFPSNVANEAAIAPAPNGQHIALGGALQPLTLDITIGYELSKRT